MMQASVPPRGVEREDPESTHVPLTLNLHLQSVVTMRILFPFSDLLFCGVHFTHAYSKFCTSQELARHHLRGSGGDY